MIPHGRLHRHGNDSRPPAGFTLVELMVVLVVLAMLAALTLSGLSGARERAKADKTRSTIRKIHEIVIPHYESYLSRRVRSQGVVGTLTWKGTRFAPPSDPPPTVSSSAVPAANRLWGLRVLSVLEMPDQWADVAPNPTFPNLAIPTWAVTSPVKRFASMKTASPPTTAYEGAECLAMIVMRGGLGSDVVESFRADEVGDVDKDRHPEFLDGWGKPISFIRWPVGFVSPVLSRNVVTSPDPFDPMRLSGTVAYPNGDQTDYGVYPLIYSGGGDNAMQISETGTSATSPNYAGYAAAPDVTGSQLIQLGTGTGSITIPVPVPSNRLVTSGTLRPGSAVDQTAVRDNITNYDLLKK